MRFFLFAHRDVRETQVTFHSSFARKFSSRETSGYEAGMSVFLMLFQALDWIHENGEFYLSSRTGEGESDAQTKELLDEHQEFKEASEVHELVCATFFRSFHCYFHCVFIITCASHCNGNHNVFVICLPTSRGCVFIFINFAPRHEKPRKANRGEIFTGKIIVSKFYKKGRFPWKLTKPTSKAIHFLTSDWSESSGHSEAE